MLLFLMGIAALYMSTLMYINTYTYIWWKVNTYVYYYLDGYRSTVQGLLDWFEVDLGFTKLWLAFLDSKKDWFVYTVRENSQQIWVLPGESDKYRTRQVVIIFIRTMNLNSIRISMVRGHAPYKYPPRNTMPQSLGTNSNPLRISWSDTSFSPTEIGAIHVVYRVAKTHRIPYLYRSFSAKETYI